MSLQALLKLVHFIRDLLYYTFKVANCIGRLVLWFLVFVGDLCVELASAIRIIAEEFYRFLCELNTGIQEIIDYIGSTTNSSIDVIINSFLIFGKHVKRFFVNTELHTKLLATNIGDCMKKSLKLFYNALLLIGDLLIWIITLLPRAFCYGVLHIGDILVFSVNGLWFGVLYAIKLLIEDILRLSVGIVVLTLLWSHRRKISNSTIRVYRALKMFLIRTRRVFYLNSSSSRNRNGNVAVPIPTNRAGFSSPRSQSKSGAANTSNHLNQSIDLCIVCRDREKNVVLLPCRHLCMCEECADYLSHSAELESTCPLCRESIAHRFTVYT